MALEIIKRTYKFLDKIPTLSKIINLDKCLTISIIFCGNLIEGCYKLKYSLFKFDYVLWKSSNNGPVLENH